MTKTRVMVQRTSLDAARKVLTIVASDAVWLMADLKALPSDLEAQGAIVRVFPPFDTSDATVNTLLALLRKVARVVRLMPRPTAPAVLSSPKSPTPAKVSKRQVVLDTAHESKIRDLPALLDVLNKVMDEVGL
jgi:hypothetical protein